MNLKDLETIKNHTEATDRDFANNQGFITFPIFNDYDTCTEGFN